MNFLLLELQRKRDGLHCATLGTEVKTLSQTIIVCLLHLFPQIRELVHNPPPFPTPDHRGGAV